MKDTGISRPIDNMGRVVIPKELRAAAKLRPGDRLEIYTDADGIVLRKFEPSCIFCKGDADDLVSYRGIPVCRNCLAALNATAQIN